VAAPVVIVVDSLLDVADASEVVEDASTEPDEAAEGVVEATAEEVVGATAEGAVEVTAEGVVEVTAAGRVVEAVALTGVPAFLVQNPCSGVTSG